MKILDTPTTNISELKKSPSKAFAKAKEEQTGVYVFNRDVPAGVVLSVEDYEQIVRENEDLQEKLYDVEIERRLKEKNPELIDGSKVDGDSLDKINFDENDGWE